MKSLKYVPFGSIIQTTPITLKKPFSTKLVVAKQERLLDLEGQVCSSSEAGNKNKIPYLFGVRFLGMNDDKRLLLNCFVYERLVHEIFKD